MRILSIASDGGKTSGVRGLYLIEIKSLFSIVLLRFNEGSREALHSHAFNALSWWLSGTVTEERHYPCGSVVTKTFRPALKPKVTPRDNLHKITAHKGGAWCFTIRGPWVDRWVEVRNGKRVVLTHGRVEV